MDHRSCLDTETVISISTSHSRCIFSKFSPGSDIFLWLYYTISPGILSLVIISKWIILLICFASTVVSFYLANAFATSDQLGYHIKVVYLAGLP
jgi:hypothetical protein